jgi:hypothetical protein
VSKDLKCVAQAVSRIATAEGFLSDGVSGAISFELNPASIRTEVPGQQVVQLTGIEYDCEFDEVTLRWKAEIGKSYDIQYYDEFRCWKGIFFDVVADEVEESEFIVPERKPGELELPKTQLYRVVERE